MIKQNLHTHSSFSDGADSMEEMVLSAIVKGFESLGFSEHAYTPYDLECCIKEDDIPAYFTEFDRLKEKYAGQILLFRGIECDSHYFTPKDGFDYTIGSAHYVVDEKGGTFNTVDHTHEKFRNALDQAAGGDIRRLVKMYYDDIVKFTLDYKPDIVGHMDLIRKLNEGNRYFDPKSEWYDEIISGAAEKIAEAGCIVEINTGGIYRGYLKEPYPSKEILARLFELKVPVTISADAHNAGSIDFWFEEAAALIKETGYRSIKQLTAAGFVDVEI